MGFDKTKEEIVPRMSEEMKKSGKSAIAKFGFKPWEYEAFLKSVAAMNEISVLEYSNEQIDTYRLRFVKNHEKGLNDMFMFDSLAKIQIQDEKKIWHDTGYFCPRMFWDEVLAY